MVPCGSSPVTRFALASAMRKTKRLRRRLTLFHIWKNVEGKFYKFSLETGEGRVELFSISGFRGYLLLLCGEKTERKN